MAESRSLLAAEFLPRQKLRIVNQIGDVIAGSLAQLPDGQIEAASRDGAPWQVGDAEVLLTGPSAGWRAAPAQPPEGWPHDLRWVQIASSGTDGFPDWLFDVPNVTTGRGLTAGAIAEYVFAAIFDDLKNLAARQAHGPADYRAPDVLTPLGTLEGKTLGLAGFGAIGEAVAKRAIAFGSCLWFTARTQSLIPRAYGRRRLLQSFSQRATSSSLLCPIMKRRIIAWIVARLSRPSRGSI